MFIIAIVYGTRIALHREMMYLLYCSHKSIESILNTCCTYGCSYTITPACTDMHGPRTDVHGHWPVRAMDSTDISLCVPRTHGHATDMPRTFPVAQRACACVRACTCTHFARTARTATHRPMCVSLSNYTTKAQLLTELVLLTSNSSFEYLCRLSHNTG